MKQLSMSICFERFFYMTTPLLIPSLAALGGVLILAIWGWNLRGEGYIGLPDKRTFLLVWNHSQELAWLLGFLHTCKTKQKESFFCLFFQRVRFKSSGALKIEKISKEFPQGSWTPWRFYPGNLFGLNKVPLDLNLAPLLQTSAATDPETFTPKVIPVCLFFSPPYMYISVFGLIFWIWFLKLAFFSNVPSCFPYGLWPLTFLFCDWLCLLILR